MVVYGIDRNLCIGSQGSSSDMGLASQSKKTSAYIVYIPTRHSSTCKGSFSILVDHRKLKAFYPGGGGICVFSQKLTCASKRALSRLRQFLRRRGADTIL